jgi:hypothetical protein
MLGDGAPYKSAATAEEDVSRRNPVAAESALFRSLSALENTSPPLLTVGDSVIRRWMVHYNDLPRSGSTTPKSTFEARQRKVTTPCPYEGLDIQLPKMSAFASVGSVVLLPTRTASDNAPSKRMGVANGLDGHENIVRTVRMRVKPFLG